LSECGKSLAEVSQLVGASEAVVDAVLSEDRYAIAAKYLAKKRKVPIQQIGEALSMSEARVHGAVYNDGASQVTLGGRLLGNNLQARLDELCDEDSEMCCPVTLMLFKEPVIASDGFMYEADSVKALIRNHQASPITREPLRKEYYPAKQKKSEVNAFRERRSQDLLDFARGSMDERGRALGLIKAADATCALDRADEAMYLVNEAMSICTEMKYEEGKAAAMNVIAKVMQWWAPAEPPGTRKSHSQRARRCNPSALC